MARVPRLDSSEKPATLPPLTRGCSLSKDNVWWKVIENGYFINSLDRAVTEGYLYKEKLRYLLKAVLLKERESKSKKKHLLLRNKEAPRRSQWKLSLLKSNILQRLTTLPLNNPPKQIQRISQATHSKINHPLKANGLLLFFPLQLEMVASFLVGSRSADALPLNNPPKQIQRMVAVSPI